MVVGVADRPQEKALLRGIQFHDGAEVATLKDRLPARQSQAALDLLLARGARQCVSRRPDLL